MVCGHKKLNMKILSLVSISLLIPFALNAFFVFVFTKGEIKEFEILSLCSTLIIAFAILYIRYLLLSRSNHFLKVDELNKQMAEIEKERQIIRKAAERIKLNFDNVKK